jgi:hypothetical protein
MQISRLTFLGACWKPAAGLSRALGSSFFLSFSRSFAPSRERSSRRWKSCSLLAQKPIKHTAESVHQKPRKSVITRQGRTSRASFFHPRVFLRTCYQSFRLRWLAELISNNRTWHEIAKKLKPEVEFCARSRFLRIPELFLFYGFSVLWAQTNENRRKNRSCRAPEFLYLFSLDITAPRL